VRTIWGESDTLSLHLAPTSLPPHAELLNYPWGIGLANGLVYVSDMRGRICVFDASSLQLLFCLMSTASGLTSPHAMAIVNDSLFIADYDRHHILVLGLTAAGVSGELATAAPSGEQMACSSSAALSSTVGEGATAVGEGARDRQTGDVSVRE
jgi:hypothetical protein